MSIVADRDAAGHDVLFADSDAELAAVAGARLSAAHTAGATLIVIATPAHLRAMAETFSDEALASARSDGSLIELDAAETLARLCPGGAFAPDAFDAVVGTLVRRAAAGGAVNAFGEMVGLLWEDGRVQEAIDLEAAWNTLLDETGAELLCAYASSLVDDETRAGDLDTVCRLHSAVVAADRFDRSWRFAGQLTAVRQARTIITSALRARGLHGTALMDAQILVAELVANAVEHGRSAFTVSISIDHDRVLVSVADDSAELPVVAGPRTSRDSSGRGMQLVHRLARRWGVDPLPLGKSVWAEVDR